MKKSLFFRPAFLSLALLSSMAVAQIPEGCNAYTYHTDYCSDNNGAGGACLGSLPEVIDDLVGDGYYGAEWGTANCHLNTQCSSNCPQCNPFSEPIQAYNSTCVGGGGGGGCKDGDCPCGDGTCDGTCCSDATSGSLTARSKKPCTGAQPDSAVLVSWNIFSPYLPDTQTMQKELDDMWQKVQAARKAKEMKKIDRALNGAL